MVYVGIDVSKDHLDVAERPKGDVGRIANDDGDINKLVSELKALKPQLIVMEATGGYEMPLAGALASGGLPVSVSQPPAGAGLRQVHREARQDRLYRCQGARTLRRGHTANPKAPARRASTAPVGGTDS